MTLPPGVNPCMVTFPADDHVHRCSGPAWHSGGEHPCRICGDWYGKDGAA